MPTCKVLTTFFLKNSVTSIFYCVFLIEQIFLVPLAPPRKDFEFFRIFDEIFVFVINSLVYSPQRSRDSPAYSSPESRPRLVYKKSAGAKYTRETRLPCELWIIHCGVLSLWLIRHLFVFFVNLFWCLFKNTPESRIPGVLITGESGVETTRYIHHRRVETARCIHHPWGVETPGYS
jgi:hypothetical protein